MSDEPIQWSRAHYGLVYLIHGWFGWLGAVNSRTWSQTNKLAMAVYIYIYNYIHIYIYTFKCFGFHLRFPHAKDSSFVIFKVVRPQHVTRMSNFYRQQEIPPHSRSGHQTFANLPKLAPFRSHVADRAMQWYLDASRQGQNNAYGIMGGWW